MPSSPPVPIPSATILLVRDGAAASREGLEVFMVERHPKSDFASGALVFPGGMVDPGDRDPALRERCRGTDGLDDDALALRVAGIRETFEECRVLLARRRGEEALVDAGDAADLEARYRAHVHAGRVAIRELARAEDLELACDLLVPFAHWITPEFMPRRFDTHFFLVAAPAGQLAEHDGVESVDSVWITPADAEAENEAGRRTVIFPTLLNVRRLGESPCLADALAAARARPVVTVLPRVGRSPEGKRELRLPPEAGYGDVFDPS